MADLNTIFQLKNARSRALSAENPTGAPGMAATCPREQGYYPRASRELPEGWKTNPFIRLAAGATATLADVDGPGVINYIWITASENRWRELILRMYWDGQENPSVECPLGDFFCAGWEQYYPVNSAAVCVNPGKTFNCYWQMPFRRHCRITLENIGDQGVEVLAYYIDYTLREIPEDSAYFHAQFRRVNPLPYKEVYTILDGVQGKGQYVGTYMAWGANNCGWWGEGEIKFYMDGDTDFPTICGTGTEDYFCGAWCFKDMVTRNRYINFDTPYSGFHCFPPDEFYRSQMRFGMYRWHITDPIRFEKDLRVTIQALGWRSGDRYLPLQDDIASVAFWYQTLPTAPFPPLPDRDYLEVI